MQIYVYIYYQTIFSLILQRFTASFGLVTLIPAAEDINENPRCSGTIKWPGHKVGDAKGHDNVAGIQS